VSLSCCDFYGENRKAEIDGTERLVSMRSYYIIRVYNAGRGRTGQCFGAGCLESR
jgi:hypothetical protein